MTRQVINRGTSANDGTGDTLRAAAGKINENFAELYTLLGGDSLAISDFLSLSDSGLGFNHTTYRTVLTSVEGSSDIIVTIPDSSGTLITNSSTATLTNKTLTTPLLVEAIAKSLRMYDADSSHQFIFVPGNISANRNITIPALTANDTLVFQAQTQTITNKTIDGPKITRAIFDSSGAEILRFISNPSAINEIYISNREANASVAGEVNDGPLIGSTGGDTNINIRIQPKGTGSVKLGKQALSIKSISAGGDSDMTTASLVVASNAGAWALTLNDGLMSGEIKKVLNKGAGALTLTAASDFNNGDYTTANMASKGAIEVVWDNTDNTWYILSRTDSATGLVTFS